MKTLLKNIFPVLTLIATLLGCDKIEGPYREGTNTVIGENDSTIIIGDDTIVFAEDNLPAMKKVLVEDYTGHLCGNCPYAGLYLNDTLKAIYGDKFIAISVHAGFFSPPCPTSGAPCPGAAAPPGAFSTDFRCPTGNDWDTKFGNSSQGNPNGMVDRIDYPASNVKFPDTWNAHIQSQSLLPADLKIRIINRYDAATRELKTAVQVKALTNLPDAYKLQLALTEDSIIDWQEWYLPHIPQFDSSYIHRHVLRAAINGSFGQDAGNLSVGSTLLNGFTYTLNSNYNATHCKVVAFIYDAATYRVLQVEEKGVLE